MKSLIKIIAAALICCFVACGDSMESDAKKTAEKAYRAELQWDGKIEMSVKEQKEIIEWGSKMLKKYGNDTKQSELFRKMVETETQKIRKKNKK